MDTEKKMKTALEFLNEVVQDKNNQIKAHQDMLRNAAIALGDPDVERRHNHMLMLTDYLSDTPVNPDDLRNRIDADFQKDYPEDGPEFVGGMWDVYRAGYLAALKLREDGEK